LNNDVYRASQPDRKSGSASRTFSPAVKDALAKALSSYDPLSPESDAQLRTTLLAAVAEARRQSWRPEELVAELRAAIPESVGSAEDRVQIQDLLKRRALVAYFGQSDFY
jgi:hypothetical protein